MKNADVLLLFPPLTEARLFPYASLPMITGYLRMQGISTHQIDLNLRLSQAIFTSKNFQQYLAFNPISTPSLKEQYRQLMATYFIDIADGLHQEIFKSHYETTTYDLTRKVRLVRQGIDLLLENSILSQNVLRYQDFDNYLEAFLPNGEDIGFTILTQLVEELLDGAYPLIIGLSVTFYSQILPTLLLCKLLKTLRPESKIILGGQQVMMRKEKFCTLKVFKNYVDYLGFDKGEATISKLHEHLNQKIPFSSIPHIIQLSKTAEAIQSPNNDRLLFKNLPAPDFTGLDLYGYLSADVQLGIITCVGCYWGRCTFCSYGNRSYLGKKYEQGTPTQIANICQTLLEKHGIQRINFVDENTNLKLVVQAMRMLNERGFTMRFSTRNRLEKILKNKAFCQELKERGCVLMSVGYETNSQRLLDKMNKGVQAADYQIIIDNLHEVGIPVRFSIMGGLFDETKTELANSIAFLKRNEHKIGIDVMQMLIIEPNTILAKHPEQFNLQPVVMDQLRGNEALNYGMGRVGQDYRFLSGGNFDTRLRAFFQLYEQVNPANNDELSPDKRVELSAQSSSILPSIRKIRLFSWVKLLLNVKEPHWDTAQHLLVDLLWQRFYVLPPSLDIDIINYDDGTVEIHANTAIPFLKELLNMELGQKII